MCQRPVDRPDRDKDLAGPGEGRAGTTENGEEMRITKWLVLLVAVLGVGLIAAGCGDDDESTTEVTATTEEDGDVTATTEESTSEDTSSEETDVADNESIDSETFYNACIDTASGTPAEATAEQVCGQARDALEQCATTAEASGDDSVAESAIKLCQDAADQAVSQLEAAAG